MSTSGKGNSRKQERHLRLQDDWRVLWEKVLPFLSNPVKRKLAVGSLDRKKGGALAGETALSRYTMLSEPTTPVIAVSAAAWNDTKGAKGRKQGEPPRETETEKEVEIWKYDPALFARKGLLDRLSLFLSLRESPDERVLASLDRMMEEMEW